MTARNHFRPGRAALVAVAAGALVVSLAPAAGAQQVTDGAGAGLSGAGLEETAALARDLDLTEEQAAELMDQQTQASRVVAELRESLGAAYGGAWYEADGDVLHIGVTDAGVAGLATDAGAQVTVVERSKAELESVVSDLNAAAASDDATLAEVYMWGIDVPANQVTVTVAPGSVDAAVERFADYGDAVAVEEGVARPETQVTIRGGDRYNTNTSACSVGFNGTYNGARVFVTAGHCGTVGTPVSVSGTSVGSFMTSFFPTYDDALVQVTNSSVSQPGQVNTYPGSVSVSAVAAPVVGMAVCASGFTTGNTCGTVNLLGVTANYAQGPVYDLFRHTACTEPGDSGGAVYRATGTAAAVGITSGGQMINGQCLEKFGQTNVSLAVPMVDIMNYYPGLSLN